MVTLDFKEEKYGLLFNGNAMFAVAEEFNNRPTSKIIYGSGKQGLIDLAKLLAIMNEQYNLYQAYMGGQRERELTAEALTEYFFSPIAQPYEFAEFREAARQAAQKGYSREVEVEGDIDLDLQEIQKKSKKAGKKPLTSESAP